MADDSRFKNSVVGTILIGVLTTLIPALVLQRCSSNSTAKPSTDPAASSTPTPQPTPQGSTRTASVFDPVSNVRAFPNSSSAIVCSIDSVRDIQVGLNATNTGKAIWWTTNVCGAPGYIADNQVHVDMLCSK